MKKINNNSGADPGFDRGGGPDRDRPKTAILGPQFCRILVLAPHFWWSEGGPGPPGPPLDPPLQLLLKEKAKNTNEATRLWMNVFKECLSENGLPQLEDITDQSLAEILPDFYAEI